MESKKSNITRIIVKAWFAVLVFIPVVVLIYVIFTAIDKYKNPPVQYADPSFPPYTKPTMSQEDCDSTVGHVTPPPPIKPFVWKGTGLVTLWFDDAWQSQYLSGAFQAMEKDGYVGALAVPTLYICMPEFMTWNQIREMQNKGWEITSHTVSHLFDYNKYTPAVIVYELLGSKNELQARGLRADNFVMPYGYKPELVPNVVAFAKLHYMTYRRAGDAIDPIPVTNPYSLDSFAVTDTTTVADVQNWVNAAAKNKGWLIIVFHQIDEKQRRYDITPEMFNNILAIIKKSKLPVVLPTQALDIGKH